MFRGQVSASAAAGFIGLLSLFNIAGRIFWASLSDRIGRKPTYAVFFGLGMLLYAAVPMAAGVVVFVAIVCVIMSMYGGGFATIPAYLSDQFGVTHVSAIHGRLLTAWSTAGILGPVLVNYIREFQIDRGVCRPPMRTPSRCTPWSHSSPSASCATSLCVPSGTLSLPPSRRASPPVRGRP
jgi:MFS family permease